MNVSHEAQDTPGQEQKVVAISTDGKQARRASDPPKLKSLLADAVGKWELVTFIGLLVYLTTLGFEHGWAAYWGYPSDLIVFSTENAVRVFIALLCLAYFGGMAVHTTRNAKYIRWVMWPVLIVMAMAAAVLFYRMLNDFEAALTPALIVSFFVFAVSLGAICRAPFEPSRTVTRWLPKPVLVYACLLASVPWMAVFAGYTLAWQKSSFVVVLSSPELVVLRSFGSTAVAVEIEEAGPSESGTRHKFGRGFRVIELSGLENSIERRSFMNLGLEPRFRRRE